MDASRARSGECGHLKLGGPNGTAAGPGRMTQLPRPLVNPDDFISGGPMLDGIPPIDVPEFVPVSEAWWIDPRAPVIVVELAGDARAYPLQMMLWHEIVNDTVGGADVAITFSALCNMPVAFVRPVTEGEATTFGTSGKLYHSNLVMYDRVTESYWLQATGLAVFGPLTGTKLERVPVVVAPWREFRDSFPHGIVLSHDTGFDRDYGRNPYPGYDDPSGRPVLFVGEVDGRLPPLARVLGVDARGEASAFSYSALEEQARGGRAVVNSEVGGEPVTILWTAQTFSVLDTAEVDESRDVGAAAAYSREIGGRPLTLRAVDSGVIDDETASPWSFFGSAMGGRLSGTRLHQVDAHDSFWFSWVAFHPHTKLWSG